MKRFRIALARLIAGRHAAVLPSGYVVRVDPEPISTYTVRLLGSGQAARTTTQ